MKIYLAGSVPKGDKEAMDFKNWRLEYQEILKNIFDAEFIDPYERELDESDFFGVVGKDCGQIRESDLIIVNAENKLGVGTSQELVIAKYFKKPVVTILPKDSAHRKSNVLFNNINIEDWIHPFIFTFSDLIYESIEKINKNEIENIKPKDISIIDRAISHFEEK